MSLPTNRAKSVSVLLPDVLIEGVDQVAVAEYTDRSAIIRSALKSYLRAYVATDLTESDMIELRSRAVQRDSFIPYAITRKRLDLVDPPQGRKGAGRTRNKKSAAR